MRCPSCGTENEPDSRFCGGCGSRLQGTLAPTHKIVDQAPAAPYPVQPSMPPAAAPPPPIAQQAQAIARQVSAEYAAHRQPSGPRVAQPTPARPSMPQPARPSMPQPARPGMPQPARPSMPQPARPSMPQQARPSAPQQARPSTPQPAPRPSPAAGYATPNGSSPRRRSSERPVDRLEHAGSGRRWGVILVVLLVDLGLAAAGAYLLHEGMTAGAAPASSAPATGTAPPQTTPATTTATTAPAARPAVKPVVVSATAAPVDAGVVPPDAAPRREAKPAPPRKRPRPRTRTGPRSSGTPRPVDPYGEGPTVGPSLPPPPLPPEDPLDDPDPRASRELEDLE